MPPSDEPLHTHFGFESVLWQEKRARVKGVFDSVASSYDVMNDLMSLGIHRLWKRAFMATLAPRQGKALLDVAGGTGDIALRYLDAVEGIGSVTLCDINAAMLSEGRDRLTNLNRTRNIEFLCGNAEALPVADRAFDYYTIAFGIRNVTDIPAALREAKRVLKPGGRFLCLEFSQVNNPLLAQCYDAFSFNVIPALGEWVAKDRASYQYLVESIRKFPPPEAFADMIRAAGFSRVTFTPLSGGIVAIHSGWRT